MPILLVCILSLLAGSGVFIAGMNMMSGGLEKATGKGLKRLLSKISNNRFAGVGIGASVTALIQSSAATSVMVIGFVNAGAMTLFQAAAIIMGANIGTTVTGLLVSLSSLNISLFTSLFAFIGVMMMFFKNQKVKNIGSILCGLGLIFIGLDLMSAAFAEDEIKQVFCDVFTSIDFPLLLILIGIIFTVIVQSSSAVTGLIIIMVGQGALPISNALFIVLGSNIGTCVTALIACIGTGTNAKRTGFIHLAFNVIGTIIFTIFLWIFTTPIVNALEKICPNNLQIQIALFHVFFNVVTTLLLLPFIKQLVKLSTLVIKDKQDNGIHSLKYIDERLLRTPAVALMQVKKEVEHMADLARTNIQKAFDELINQSGKNVDEVYKREEKIDYINNAITKYLIKLSSLVDAQNEKVIGSYFHVVNDIERIGDHAENLLEIGTQMKNEELVFSSNGNENINQMFDIIMKMFEIAMDTFDNGSHSHLMELTSYEEQVDELKKELTSQHYMRLSMGDCKMELSSYFTSTISGLERVGDHLVNIGYSIINPTGAQIIEKK